MNFIKRGFLGITRKTGKSLILLAVIFILGNLISGAISIQQATGNVEETIKERLGTAATLEMDHEALDKMSEEEWMEIEFEDISVDLIKQIGELPYVKYYDYSMSTHIGSKSIESYQGEDTDDSFMMYEDGMEFMLKGINYAPVIDFEEEKASLVDGRVFTQEEVDNGTSVAIISKKLADQNNLHVGDTFTLENAIYTYDEDTGEQDKEAVATRDVVLEVIGLFEPKIAIKEQDDNSSGDMIDFMDMELQNAIYVPNAIVISEDKYHWEEYMKNDPEYAAMLEEEGEDTNFEYYTPMFVLKNLEDSEAFEEEVLPLLPELYKVTSATDQYDNIAGPMASMSKLAKYVLIAAVVATVMITGLVVLLFLRDRKHELGIYLSLGEKRSRVVGQILIEVMVVAFIGITISLFSGNFLAGQISETLMKVDDNSDPYGDMYYYSEFESDLTTDDVLDSYEVNLNLSYVLSFYIIGLLTILISTIIPLLYIVRLNPKKILM